jgi:hypothetical protein
LLLEVLRQLLLQLLLLLLLLLLRQRLVVVKLRRVSLDLLLLKIIFLPAKLFNFFFFATDTAGKSASAFACSSPIQPGIIFLFKACTCLS